MRGGLGVKYKLPTRVPGGGDARQYYAQDTTTLPVRPRGSLTASGTFECMRKSTFYHTTPRASTRLHGSFSSGKACFHRGVTRLSNPAAARRPPGTGTEGARRIPHAASAREVLRARAAGAPTREPDAAGADAGARRTHGARAGPGHAHDAAGPRARRAGGSAAAAAAVSSRQYDHRRDGGTGRRTGLKIPRGASPMRVRFSLSAL